MVISADLKISINKKVLVICSGRTPLFYNFLDSEHEYHGIFCSDVDPTIITELISKFTNIMFIENYEIENIAHMLLSKYTYNFIIGPCENDILLAARLRDTYKINGQNYENALHFKDKLVMKSICKKAGIRVPKFAKIHNENKIAIVSSFIEKNKFPVVIKPIDMSGSRNVHIIRNKYDMLQLIENLDTHLIRYEIEEYIDGDFYHVDGIFEDDEVKLCFPSKYVNSCVETTFYNIDCSYIVEKNALSDKICDFTRRIIKALGQGSNFVFHLELFNITHNGDDELVFCEVGCRVGGNGIHISWEKTFGINLLKEQINIALGNKSTCCMQHTVNLLIGSFNIPAKNGKIMGLPIKCELNGISEYTTFYKNDDIIKSNDTDGFKNKLVFGYVTGKSEKELLDNLDNFKQWFYKNTEII
jgi:biotin carboxylase